MHRLIPICLIISLLPAVPAWGAFQTDTFATSEGPLTITFIGHGTLMLDFNGKIIHVDPWSKLADYGELPGADLVLITHDHIDHFDEVALEAVRGPETPMVLPTSCEGLAKGATLMANGDIKTVAGVRIEAVPAYNIVHKRDNGRPYHPKGVGNGYVLTLGDKRVYIAGDTENIPEMAGLEGIDIAFLPMNLPYTMTPEMAADAARSFSPKVLYPYHYGETDPEALVKLLKDGPIEVRVRAMR